MAAAVENMAQMGFEESLVISTVQELLKVDLSLSLSSLNFNSNQSMFHNEHRRVPNRILLAYPELDSTFGNQLTELCSSN